MKRNATNTHDRNSTFDRSISSRFARDEKGGKKMIQKSRLELKIIRL